MGISSIHHSLTSLKNLSLATLTTSILLALTINIYRTYNYTNTLTKVVENSENNIVKETDVTNANSTNNNAKTLDPAYIGMDISSSSATDGSANLELTIPQDSNNAGIAIGSHTIHITTGSKVLGYELSLSSSSYNPGSTSLLPTDTSVTTNPTVKLDQHANVGETIGGFYAMARSIGQGNMTRLLMVAVKLLVSSQITII